VAYGRSCRRANTLINTSRFKFFHDELESAADCKERWQISKLLLNYGQSVYVRTANENSNLCTKFSQFFVDKMDALKRAVAKETVATFPSECTHIKQLLKTLSPEEFDKIIMSIPAKSSPLDFIPTSSIKDIHFTFCRYHCQAANLSFTEGVLAISRLLLLPF